MGLSFERMSVGELQSLSCAGSFAVAHIRIADSAKSGALPTRNHLPWREKKSYDAEERSVRARWGLNQTSNVATQVALGLTSKAKDFFASEWRPSQATAQPLAHRVSRRRAP